MTDVAAIRFIDLDSDDEAFVSVRTIGEVTGLTLSLTQDGDIAVFMQARELDQLIEALQKAHEIVGKKS